MLIVEHGDHPVPDEPTPHRRLRPRDRRGIACDVVAILSALVLVGLGLANLYAVDGLDMAVRQAAIAGGGDRAAGGVVAVPDEAADDAGLGHLRRRRALSGRGARRRRDGERRAEMDRDRRTDSSSPPNSPRWDCCWSSPRCSARADRRGSGSSLAIGLAAAPIALTLLQPDLSTTMLLLGAHARRC